VFCGLVYHQYKRARPSLALVRTTHLVDSQFILCHNHKVLAIINDMGIATMLYRFNHLLAQLHGLTEIASEQG